MSNRPPTLLTCYAIETVPLDGDGFKEVIRQFAYEPLYPTVYEHVAALAAQAGLSTEEVETIAKDMR